MLREAFKDLLKGWGRALDLTFVPEYEIESPAKVIDLLARLARVSVETQAIVEALRAASR